MIPPVGRTRSVALLGLDGHVVDIEVLAVSNVPAFVLVGLPDTALGESRDRIRAAFASSGFTWPNKRVTVNLSPAWLPKSGSGFDLGIAVAVLAACGIVSPTRIADAVHLGELGLDGRVRPIRGVLPAVVAAVKAGLNRVVVPAANAAEAQLVNGAQVLAASSLAELAWRLGADIAPPDPPDLADDADTTAASSGLASQRPPGDLAEVVGQAEARAALEIAAAGAHHLLMIGPPGTGKTMLAARLPGILPDLTPSESIETTAIHSLAGGLGPDAQLMLRPPFESPHHTATRAAIIGGGSGIPRPGAISRAHRGVLFLDEAPEFPSAVLDTLRQPLEEGRVVIHRAQGVATYPAQFQLVLAANPCPCGRASGKALTCTCTPLVRRRYFGRLSGPLLDRIDMSVGVEGPRGVKVGTGGVGESSAAVAERVAQARQAQRERLGPLGWSTNAEVPGAWLRGRIEAGSRMSHLLNTALERELLSLRGVDRVLRVAWSVADLAGRGSPSPDDLDVAMALRTGATP